MALTVQDARANFNVWKEIVPGVVADSAEDIATSDCWIEGLIFNNKGSTSATVTVADKQSTPVALVTALPVDPGAPVVINLRGAEAYMKSGFTLVASVADAVVVRGRFKY